MRIKIHHGDHEMTEEVREYILNYLKRLIRMGTSGFEIVSVPIPPRVGTIPNALYGPSAGDPPVSDEEVFMRRRGDRSVSDRMIDKPMRPWDSAIFVGMLSEDGIEAFTIYGGPLAAQNPDDPSCKDVEGARAFWAEHALSSHQPTS